MYAKVYVEITNICNMACSFCHGHSRPHRQMQEKDFFYILQQLKGQTQYIYYHLMGEPLSHPELPHFLQLAKENGYKSVITTNGTLLQTRGQSLIDAGVHKVSVSVHSLEQGDGTAYLTQVAEFAEKASKAGVIVVLRLWNKGHDDGRNDATEDFFRKRLAGDWRENAKGYRIHDKLYLEYGDRFDWPDKNAPDRGEQVFCYGLRDQFGILCDGTVVPCCLDSEGVISLGNIFETDIGEILSSSRAKAMVKGFGDRKATEDLCRRCGYARRFG